MPVTNASAIPAELALHPPNPGPLNPTSEFNTPDDEKVRAYVVEYRNQLWQSRWARQNIWNECWQLYRGQEDWSDKDDWQTKIVLPKAWASVKQATNVIKRLLATSKEPWNVESQNPDDLINVQRSQQMTELSKVFLEKASFEQEFAEGLEIGFILGLGVWKVWWGLVPRTRTRVITQMVPGAMTPQGQPMGGQASGPLMSDMPDRQVPPPFGQGFGDYASQNAQQYPEQLPGESLAPQGWQGSPQPQSPMPPQMVPQKQIVREEILEGQLVIRAVDPYNFYWLPGSKLNRWVGTIEDVEIARWELLELADAGAFGPDGREKVESIKPMKIDEFKKQSALRWSETIRSQNGPNNDTGVVKLTEFYGPIALGDGKIYNRHAHVIIANDSVVLLNGDNEFWHRTPPYRAFSPLSLPLRTEGVGLIENVRAIDKALSKVTNLSVDTLLFRLLPLFEINLGVYENPEDLETGMTPGKILRRNQAYAGVQGLNTIEMPDISGSTAQTAAWLDRAHQEGALVSEIQQSIPRYRGAQSATETEALKQNSDSFMGSLAVDIEKSAIEPLIGIAVDLILQFLDTAADPRVASILGLGAQSLAGMTKEELTELVQGDYKIKVTGLSGQLQKAEMLQNLVQFMNLIGQNPQSWMPYLNSDALLRRILEAFRPALPDIENIIADPATQQAQKLSMTNDQMTPDMLRSMPQLVQMATDISMKQQQMAHEQEMAKMQQAHEATMAQQQQQAQMQQAAQQMALQKQAANLRKDA